MQFNVNHPLLYIIAGILVAVVLGHCLGCMGHLQDFENDFLKREGQPSLLISAAR